MKKSLYLLPLLLLAACSRQTDANTTPATSDTAATTPPPATQPTAADRAASAVNTAADRTRDAAQTAADRTRSATAEMRTDIAAKLDEWNLTPGDIRADLERGGRIVRTKTQAAGQQAGAMMDNARIVTVINSKYVSDADLSALKIDVDANKGSVTLNGTVKSPEHVGKAVALALDTDGVTEVVSLLKVEAK